MASDPGTSTRKRFWFDPRFALGLVLVSASVVGVGALVTAADRSSTAYAAKAPLAVGDRIDVADLVAVRIRFEHAERFYLTPEQLPSDGLLVTRTVGAGELIPVSAVGTRVGESVTNIVVGVQGELAGSVVPGTLVDVWAARETEQSQYGPPAVVVGRATVVRLVESKGLIADGRGASVEILVPKEKVGAVLESIANQDALALVPVDQPLGQ